MFPSTNCGTNQRAFPSDSLAEVNWPIMHQPLLTSNPADRHPGPPVRDPSMMWPISTPWRRNEGQPRCGGAGRCQGDAQRCNSKYRYGVDDVGPCPSDKSCRTSYSCQTQPDECAHPCPVPEGCNRLTTRCFEWPLPRIDNCTPIDTNKDMGPPRADLNDARIKPECCPTCKRVVVDMECGPLGQNY